MEGMWMSLGTSLWHRRTTPQRLILGVGLGVRGLQVRAMVRGEHDASLLHSQILTAAAPLAGTGM